MKRLLIDLETFSETPIQNGLDNYSRATEILLFAYAFDDQPAKCWDLTTGEPMPADLRAALANPALPIVAHNAGFERTVLAAHGYRISDTRWRCTMAKALAHGLPGGLDKLCEIYRVADDKAKMKEGRDLVRLFCCPRPKAQKLRRATKDTHPAEWVRFVEYCRLDVEAMREIDAKIPNWNYSTDPDKTTPAAERELALWHLDQRINARGVPVDTDLVLSALETADRVKAALSAETVELTDGSLTATTQRNALLELLNDVYGLRLDDLRGSTIEALLKSDASLPPVVVELLENRLAASSTSVAKYRSFEKFAGPDGMLRNTLQYCGASRTGRWCLAEGTRVLVLSGGVLSEKAIEQVLLSDLVWDGEEWVAHEGVVFSGDKDVIEWDGVVATKEHNVWVSADEKVQLGEAMAQGRALWRGNGVLHL